MNEILLLLLPIAAVFGIASSIALLALGKMIDRFPTGSDESGRERGLASPVESTTISVLVFWALFLPGCYALSWDTRFGTIIGITLLFAVALFIFTALGFSFAVLATMRSRKNRLEKPVIQVGTADEIITVSNRGYGRSGISSRKRNSYLTGLMMDTIVKKD